jgi:hypothetical protein
MLRSLKRRNVIPSTVVMNYLKTLVKIYCRAVAVRNQGNQMILCFTIEKETRLNRFNSKELVKFIQKVLYDYSYPHNDW